MIDNLSLLAFAWRTGTSSGVTNAELIASQDSQNTLYMGLLLALAGVIAWMFKTIDKGFKEATNERHRLELRLAKIEQLLIYTKSTEQGVPPEQVEAEVEAAARRQLESETE